MQTVLKLLQTTTLGRLKTPRMTKIFPVHHKTQGITPPSRTLPDHSLFHRRAVLPKIIALRSYSWGTLLLVKPAWLRITCKIHSQMIMSRRCSMFIAARNKSNNAKLSSKSMTQAEMNNSLQIDKFNIMVQTASWYVSRLIILPPWIIWVGGSQRFAPSKRKSP